MLAMSTILITSCVSVSPLDVTSNDGPTSTVGEYTCSTFCIFHFGDCSYEVAKKNGNITKVHHTDMATTNYIIFAVHKTIVHGY